MRKKVKKTKLVSTKFMVSTKLFAYTVAEPGDAESVEPAVQPADAQTEEQVVLPDEEAKGEDETGENTEEQNIENEEAVYVELPAGTDSGAADEAVPAKESSPGGIRGSGISQ